MSDENEGSQYNGFGRPEPDATGAFRSDPEPTGHHRPAPQEADANNGRQRPEPEMSGHGRPHPDVTGDDRSRPIVTVDPDDDSYVFTAQAASVFAGDRGIRIRDRRIRKACSKEDPTLLKCVWKRVGGTKPQWYVGSDSLDRYVTTAIQDRDREAHREGDRPQPAKAEAHSPEPAAPVPEQPDPQQDARVEELEKEVAELKKQLIDAEVEKRAAHQARDFIAESSRDVITQLSETQFKLGQAEAQLLALQAPEPHRPPQTQPGQSTIEDAIENENKSTEGDN